MVDIHATEEEQVRALKDWFRQYGLFIVVGLIIGVGGVFGVRAWDAHKLQQAQQASAQYDGLTNTAKTADFPATKAAAEKLMSEFPASPYAVQAALSLAALAVDQGEAEVAKEKLQWVLNSDALPAMKDVARLRMARIVLNIDNDAETAGTILSVDGSPEFAVLYNELRGDVAVAQKDYAAAREQYDLALENWDEDLGSNDLLRMKRDDVEGK